MSNQKVPAFFGVIMYSLFIVSGYMFFNYNFLHSDTDTKAVLGASSKREIVNEFKEISVETSQANYFKVGEIGSSEETTKIQNTTIKSSRDFINNTSQTKNIETVESNKAIETTPVKKPDEEPIIENAGGNGGFSPEDACLKKGGLFIWNGKDCLDTTGQGNGIDGRTEDAARI
jgi:hypothetical protein